MSIFDRSRHKMGRIVKASNNECIEFGNRSKLWEIGSDGVRGFGTDLMPGFNASSTVQGVSEGVDWSLWNQITQGNLSKDQNNDSLEDTYVVVGDAGAIEDNKGSGVVSGTDLIITQHGNISAALLDGSYYYNPIDGTNDYYSIPNGLFSGVLNGQTSWSVIWKVYITSTDIGYLCSLTSAQGTITNIPAAKEFNLTDASGSESKVTTNAWPTDQVIYVAMWTDSITTYAGITTVFPTKKSDFNANLLVTFAALFDDFNFTALGNNFMTFYDGAAAYGAGRFYWLVISSVCLIDNSA